MIHPDPVVSIPLWHVLIPPASDRYQVLCDADRMRRPTDRHHAVADRADVFIHDDHLYDRLTVQHSLWGGAAT